jgi:hypothetical protein
MDPAFLRRIPYKLEIAGPTTDNYRRIFRSVAKSLELEPAGEDLDFIIAELRANGFPLASYQPKFICDQVRAAAKFEGIPPQFRRDLVSMALGNLFTKETPVEAGPISIQVKAAA